MAEHHHSISTQSQKPPQLHSSNNHNGSCTFLRKLHQHSPSSTQLIAFITLVISVGLLLLLSGFTLTLTLLGLTLFTPLIILSSPIWVPVGSVMFLAVAGFLSMCGVGVTVLAGLSWLYKYFRGFNPPGTDRINNARDRIYDTASHVKDYAKECGGYLQNKVKDAAPGA